MKPNKAVDGLMQIHRLTTPRGDGAAVSVETGRDIDCPTYSVATPTSAV